MESTEIITSVLSTLERVGMRVIMVSGGNAEDVGDLGRNIGLTKIIINIILIPMNDHNNNNIKRFIVSR